MAQSLWCTATPDPWSEFRPCHIWKFIRWVPQCYPPQRKIMEVDGWRKMSWLPPSLPHTSCWTHSHQARFWDSWRFRNHIFLPDGMWLGPCCLQELFWSVELSPSYLPPWGTNIYIHNFAAMFLKYNGKSFLRETRALITITISFFNGEQVDW